MTQLIFKDLSTFVAALQQKEWLKNISVPVDPYLEITEISKRVLEKNGPALLFLSPKGSQIPILTNLFGTAERIAFALGLENLQQLRTLGETLAFLKHPTPFQTFREAWSMRHYVKPLLHTNPKRVKEAPCQTVTYFDKYVDLKSFPIQTCWPEDAGPLITWGMVVTRSPHKTRQNVGIYRQQVLSSNQLIMRWLAHRGGALDYAAWQTVFPNKKFPIAIVIGADPASLLSAVMPIPDDLSEYAFSGLLRGARTELVKCLTHDLEVPAHAEMVLEGYIFPGMTAKEGPFGDHTGYYNEPETYPVVTIHCITHRQNPIYLSTYTGKPPDEPAVLGSTLNELFIPILQKQFPEIVDFYLPPEMCSYRMAIVTIQKQYPGHAKRIMFGIWSFLRQFLYTKWIIITDKEINARSWSEVMWAVATRVDPKRDIIIIENTPIDVLDFSAPSLHLGSKIGIDATTKSAEETGRNPGKLIVQDASVQKQIDAMWEVLGL